MKRLAAIAAITLLLAGCGGGLIPRLGRLLRQRRPVGEHHHRADQRRGGGSLRMWWPLPPPTTTAASTRWPSTASTAAPTRAWAATAARLTRGTCRCRPTAAARSAMFARARRRRQHGRQQPPDHRRDAVSAISHWHSATLPAWLASRDAYRPHVFAPRAHAHRTRSRASHAAAAAPAGRARRDRRTAGRGPGGALARGGPRRGDHVLAGAAARRGGRHAQQDHAVLPADAEPAAGFVSVLSPGGLCWVCRRASWRAGPRPMAARTPRASRRCCSSPRRAARPEALVIAQHAQDLAPVGFQLLRADAADAGQRSQRVRLAARHLGQRGVVEDDVGRQVVLARHLGAPGLSAA